MKKGILVLQLFILTFAYSSSAQNSVDIQSLVERKQQQAKNAADQKTNFKSIVTDLMGGRYYQALVKNGILKQSDGEIQIKSTLYGILRIFDSTRRERRYFETLRWARNIQIGAGSSFTEGNKINSFSPSLTIALLNKREYKGSVNFFDKNNIDSDAIIKATVLLDKATSKIEDDVNNQKISKAEREQLRKKYSNLLMDFNSTTDFTKLNELLSPTDIKELGDLWDQLTKKYDNLQKKLSGAPLLTYTANGNYNGSQWQKINNRIEFIVGFGNKKDSVRNYDFYAGVFYNVDQDTLNKSSILNRKMFTTKFGINKVLWKDKFDGSSIIEAFGGAEFQNINKGHLYDDERANELKFDVTLSIKLTKNLYLPFQVKYNAVSGRFEGYLDLKFDIVNIFK